MSRLYRQNPFWTQLSQCLSHAKNSRISTLFSCSWQKQDGWNSELVLSPHPEGFGFNVLLSLLVLPPDYSAITERAGDRNAPIRYVGKQNADGDGCSCCWLLHYYLSGLSLSANNGAHGEHSGWALAEQQTKIQPDLFYLSYDFKSLEPFSGNIPYVNHVMCVQKMSKQGKDWLYVWFVTSVVIDWGLIPSVAWMTDCAACTSMDVCLWPSLILIFLCEIIDLKAFHGAPSGENRCLKYWRFTMFLPSL